MIRLGATAGEMRKMSEDDIFSSRLKLLVIMAKAYLKDCPAGKYRKQAIMENSHHVFYRSLQLINDAFPIKDQDLKAKPDVGSRDDANEEHMFHQRVQLLAVMAKALAEGGLRGDFKKKALAENMERICETLIFNFHIKNIAFLKVA
jgi:hypothetical protein